MKNTLCPHCNVGELQSHSKYYHLFHYLICDKCFMTYSLDTNEWLKSETKIIGLYIDNSPIFI